MHGKTMRRVLVPLLALVVLSLVLASAVSARSGARTATKPTAAQMRAVASKLIADARKVGTLNFYTSVDPTTSQVLANAFGKKYGIKVTFTRLTSGPIAARYDAEAQAGTFNADAVVISNPPFFADALSHGWMLPLKTWKDAPNLYYLPQKFKFYGSVGLGISRVNGVIINTNTVTGSNVPATWQDLLNPRWAGRMIIGDPRTVPVNMGLWQVLRKKYGDAFLRGIASQHPRVVASMVTGAQLVAAGEADVAVGANIGHITPLLTASPNAPAKLITPQGIDAGFTWNIGISAHSPNPAAGLLFVNWLLSGQGQQIFNSTGQVPTLPGVKPPPDADPLTSKYVTVSSAVSPANQAQILSLLGLTG